MQTFLKSCLLFSIFCVFTLTSKFNVFSTVSSSAARFADHDFWIWSGQFEPEGYVRDFSLSKIHLVIQAPCINLVRWRLKPMCKTAVHVIHSVTKWSNFVSRSRLWRWASQSCVPTIIIPLPNFLNPLSAVLVGAKARMSLRILINT